MSEPTKDDAEATLGDGPIEDAYRESMRGIGRALDEVLNPEGERLAGFVLIVAPIGNAEGRCNYISNIGREDVMTLLREQLVRFEADAVLKTKGPELSDLEYAVLRAHAGLRRPDTAWVEPEVFAANARLVELGLIMSATNATPTEKGRQALAKEAR